MPNNGAEFRGMLAGMPESVKRHGGGFVAASLQAEEILREIEAGKKPKPRDWLPRLTDESGRINLSLALATAFGLSAVGGGLALIHSLSQPEGSSVGEMPAGLIENPGAVVYQLEGDAFVSQGIFGGGVFDVLACQNLTDDPGRMFEIAADGGFPRGWVTGDDIEENLEAEALCDKPAADMEVNDEAAVETKQPPTRTPERGWSPDATKPFAPAELTDQPVLKPTDATPSFGVAGAFATRQRTATPTAGELQPAGQSLIEMEFLSCSGDWGKCFAEITARLQPILERSDLKWEKVQKFVMNRLYCGPDPSYPSIPLSHEGWQIYGRFPFNFIEYDGTNVVGDIWALFGLDDSGEKVVQPAIALEGGEIDGKKQGWIGLVGGTYASGEDPFNQGAGQMDVDQVLRDVNIGEKIIVRFTRNEDCGDGDLAQFIAVNYQSGDKTGSIQPLLQLGGLYYQKP